jgi:Uma2 family endonuclease
MALAEKIQSEDAQGLVEPRFEYIYGVEYAMGSPGYLHQSILLGLGAQLRGKLAPHGCEVFIAPFDVYPLYDKGDEFTFVQPDIFIACDRAKLKGSRYNGVPRFIIEILSSNRYHDTVLKFNLYQKAGVEEYWILDPEEKTVSAFGLSTEGYTTRAFFAEKEASLTSIPGLSVNFEGLFDLPWAGDTTTSS